MMKPPYSLSAMTINNLWNNKKEVEARELDAKLSEEIKPIVNQFNEGLISAQQLIFKLMEYI